MDIAELIVKAVAALLSIGALLLVLYFINKKAMKKAERMHEEFLNLEDKQKRIDKENKKLKKK